MQHALRSCNLEKCKVNRQRNCMRSILLKDGQNSGALMFVWIRNDRKKKKTINFANNCQIRKKVHEEV